MRIGVLGTGVVGRTLSAKIAELGHDVMMGTRDANALLTRKDEPAPGRGVPFAEWHSQHPDVRLGTFAQVASHGEILFNATSGDGALSAVTSAGSENLDGKILIDVSNPLDFSQGMPPILSVVN